MTDKLADLLPPRARHAVYVVLGFLTAVAPTVVAVLADGFQWSDAAILAASILPAAGFTMAASNTPTVDIR